MKSVKYWLIAVALGCFLAVGFVAGKIFFLEDATTQRGTLLYYILVPKLIQEVPLPDLSEDPVFYTTPGDGPKPPATAVRFRSRDPQHAESVIAEYFTGLGFTRSEQGGLVRGNQTVEFYRSPAGTSEVMLVTNVYEDDSSFSDDAAEQGDAPGSAARRR